MFRSGLCLVILGASVIVALTAAFALLGPAPGQGFVILFFVVFVVVPCLLLIAVGLFIGRQELPKRGDRHRTRDIVILSSGGAVGVCVVLWFVLILLA